MKTNAEQGAAGQPAWPGQFLVALGDRVRNHADCTGHRPARGAAIVLTRHEWEGESASLRNGGRNKTL